MRRCEREAGPRPSAPCRPEAPSAPASAHGGAAADEGLGPRVQRISKHEKNSGRCGGCRRGRWVPLTCDQGVTPGASLTSVRENCQGARQLVFFFGGGVSKQITTASWYKFFHCHGHMQSQVENRAAHLETSAGLWRILGKRTCYFKKHFHLFCYAHACVSLLHYLEVFLTCAF